MKENYSAMCENILNNLNDKKKLLLHSCCGPCSSYVISYLTKYFDITILYYNPNIFPYDEYLKRKEEQKRRQRDSKEIRNKNSYHAQKTKAICRKQNQPNIWILCLLFLIVR